MAGIYVHIPFCTQRCIYCDFYFVTTRTNHVSFVEALCQEIAYYAHDYASLEPIETIYFGGGTPSLLHVDDVYKILQTIHDHYDTSGLKEVTFELNPEDPDVEYLRTIRSFGIDRLSIGIQSFYARDLTFMNRSHSPEDAEAIIPLVREAGFERFSADLIFGVPGQPREYWAANLEKAVGMEIPHLSTYGLTIEEKTPLFNQVERGLVEEADEDTMTEFYQFTIEYLQSKGYDHYEVSSFARPDGKAVHNYNYWNHSNYLGFGPSAHSFWWKGLPAYRWQNIRNLKRYEALIRGRQKPLESREALRLDQLADEYIMLGLRKREGINLSHLEEHYGVDLLYERIDELAMLEGQNLIEPIRNHRVRLTNKGFFVINSVTQHLLLDD